MTSGKLNLLGIVFLFVAIATGQDANGTTGETKGSGKVYAFVNGNWFDVKTFQRWDMYSVDGRIGDGWQDVELRGPFGIEFLGELRTLKTNQMQSNEPGSLPMQKERLVEN